MNYGLPVYVVPASQTQTIAAGQTASFTFTDPRQFQVIVLVCQLSNNSLYTSTVTFNITTRTSLGPNGGGSVADSALCGLGGATFGPQVTGSYSANVTIPTK